MAVRRASPTKIRSPGGTTTTGTGVKIWKEYIESPDFAYSGMTGLSTRPLAKIPSSSSDLLYLRELLRNGVADMIMVASVPGSQGQWRINGTTIEVYGDITSGGDGLQVATSGISTAKLADASVTSDKLAAAVAGAGLTGGAGSALAVGAGDGITVGADTVSLASTTAGDGLTFTSGVLAVGGGTGITVSADGIAVDTSVIATRAYVDGVSQGLDTKESVRAISTSNITLSGTQTVDGVSLIAGDRILVAGQTTASANGIYVVASGAWSRASDADSSAEVDAGMFCFVTEGTQYADSGWVLTTDDAITLGTTSLAFAQFSGAGQITAGAGLTKTGNTIDVVAADASLTVNANDVAVKRDSAGAVILSGSGIAVNTDGTSVEISSNALRIASGAAGAGLGYSAGVLAVNAGGGLEVASDQVQIAASAAGAGLALSSGVLSVNVGSGLSISSDTVGIDASAAGAALALTSGVLDVQVDGSTIEVSSDALRVKDAGITAAKLASAAVTPAKLSFTVQRQTVLASAFTYASPISTKTVSATPLTDAQLVQMQELFRNGVCDGTKVSGQPAAAGEFRLNGTTLEVYGDVTASGDTYRVLYYS